MKKKNKNKFVSVVVINYNNSGRIRRCIDSLNKQTYKNFEIVFIDDQSTDNSQKILKKIQQKVLNLNFFITNKKTQFGCYNQINACQLGLKKSKGEIIFFLDSDDFFAKNKIEVVMNYFEMKNDLKFLMDKPYIFYNKNNKYRMTIRRRSELLISWPKISPQSCMVIKKNYLKKIFSKIKINKFPSIWFDFRLSLQVYLDYKKLIILDKYLTYYQQSTSAVTSKYKKFSSNWWKRRKEAYKFNTYLCKKNNLNPRISIDYFFSNLINLFIK